MSRPPNPETWPDIRTKLIVNNYSWTIQALVHHIDSLIELWTYHAVRGAQDFPLRSAADRAKEKKYSKDRIKAYRKKVAEKYDELEKEVIWAALMEGTNDE